jgi:hypothetical protein
MGCKLKRCLYNVDIRSKEIKMKVFDKKQVEELFQITTMYITDCCGEYVSDDCSDICPACGEHTEIITEKYEVSK